MESVSCQRPLAAVDADAWPPKLWTDRDVLRARLTSIRDRPQHPADALSDVIERRPLRVRPFVHVEAAPDLDHEGVHPEVLAVKRIGTSAPTKGRSIATLQPSASKAAAAASRSHAGVWLASVPRQMSARSGSWSSS